MLTFANLGSVRLPSWKFVGLRVRKIRRIVCQLSICNSLPVIWATIAKNRHYYVPRPSFFVCPADPPCGNHAKRCMNEDNSMLAKPLAECTHLSSTVSQLFEPQLQKNRRFHVPQPTFLFSLETPLRLSRNMLHGWKDNSVLAKPLAACTYLSSIVSELYDA